MNKGAPRFLALVLALATPAHAGPQDTEAAMSETIGEAMLTEGTGTQDGLDQWLATFSDRALAAGIASGTLEALAGTEYLPKVVHNDRHQNEFTKTIWDYLDKAVSDDRITGGVAALEFGHFVEVAEVQLAQLVVQHLRGQPDVDHDVVGVEFGAAQLQVNHVGGPVHALRRAEHGALKAVGNHEMVSDGDGVHGFGWVGLKNQAG